MFTLKITKSIREEASVAVASLERSYSRNNNSILSGAGHYYSKISEIALVGKYGWKHVDNYDYDLLAFSKEGREVRIDVKVKCRTVPPRKRFFATVAAANTRQKCDVYLFCSICNDDLYIVGWKKKREFFDLAFFHQKGEVDYSSPAGWRFRADCFNLPYDCLEQLGREPLPN